MEVDTPGLEPSCTPTSSSDKVRPLTTGPCDHCTDNLIKINSVEVFFSAIHTVWTFWSCIYHEFKDTFEENSSNEYFKTILHYFRVYSLSGFK